MTSTLYTLDSIKPMVFGANCIDHLPTQILKLTNNKHVPVVLVSDSGLVAAGIVNRVQSILEDSDFNVIPYTDVRSDPQSSSINDIASMIREHNHPCVIGLGGGSAMDAAKLACAVSGGEKSVESYALASQPLPNTQCQKIMIPTTAGTGSEVTRTCIFSNAEGRKVWAWGESLAPDLIVLDPSLTVELPRSFTAATGLDALVHAIEACTSKRNNPLTNPMAYQAIRLVRENLPKVIQSPTDLKARGAMLIAATLAGIAIDTCGTCVAHAIGHALASLTRIHHGRAVTLALQATLDWSAEESPPLFAPIAEALGVKKDGRHVSKTLKQLILETELDLSLDSKIQAEDLAEVMMSEENMPMIDNHPRHIDKKDALALSRMTLRKYNS